MNIAVVDRVEKPGHISDAEWKVRLDLAACYRLIDHIGMSDQVYNHITAAVPGSEETGKKLFLINHYGLRYREITASSLLKVDLDGNIQDAPDHPVLGAPEINPAGYVIHACIHAARPDVKCVLHTHSRAGLGVSCLKQGFMALDQGGLQFHNAIAYHDYEGMAVDMDEQARLVADMGDKLVMILRNHGLLTCGRTGDGTHRPAMATRRRRHRHRRRSHPRMAGTAPHAGREGPKLAGVGGLAIRSEVAGAADGTRLSVKRDPLKSCVMGGLAGSLTLGVLAIDRFVVQMFSSPTSLVIFSLGAFGLMIAYLLSGFVRSMAFVEADQKGFRYRDLWMSGEYQWSEIDGIYHRWPSVTLSPIGRLLGLPSIGFTLTPAATAARKQGLGNDWRMASLYRR